MRKMLFLQKALLFSYSRHIEPIIPIEGEDTEKAALGAREADAQKHSHRHGQPFPEKTMLPEDGMD